MPCDTVCCKLVGVICCSYPIYLNLIASTVPASWIAIQPDPVPAVVLTQSVDLMCTATGDPPISYTWVLMGAETTHLNLEPTSGNFTLIITQVDQYGVYICTATNDLGTDVATIEIIQASKYYATCVVVDTASTDI